MSTYRTIVSKRDTRVFTEQAVTPELERRILQAGRMAGSSKNSQPCRFIVIDEPGQKEAIAKCGDFAVWIPSATLLIAVAVPEEAPRNEFDAGRAAQNMMVAAWAEGIGSCPVSMHHVACARETLGLPENYRVSVVLAFGYPAREHQGKPETARKEWDAYVRRNRWEGAE